MARRRSRQGRRSSPTMSRNGRQTMASLGSNDLQNRRDLIVSGGSVNNAGAQVAGSSWNGSAKTLAPGNQLAWQAIVLPQAVTAINAPPSTGQCKVLSVEGSFYISTPTVSGKYYIGMGIYISKFDSRTGTWGVRYPSNASSDAARDDWLALRVVVVTLPLPSVITDPMMVELHLDLPHPISLGGGEALHVCVDNNGSSVGSFDVDTFFRTRISDVT